MTTIDVVLPVYNEEHVLARSVIALRQFLNENLPHPFRIVIADNASNDKTWELAQALSQQHSDVICLHLDQKGRGQALRHAWLDSSADIVSYMDVDLSTNLEAFPKLIQAIEEGYDVAVGSRHLPASLVKRSPGRELTSRSYNFLIKAMFLARLSDAQCGFKALSSEAAQELVPLIRNQGWFFDTELLILAHKKGYRVKEIPVTWVEDPDSKVSITKTALEELKGLLRMRFRPRP